MENANLTIGVIGGSGMLGGSISKAILGKNVAKAQNFWISNRSGNFEGFENYPDINKTNNNKTLVDNCDIILLSVPPAQALKLSIVTANRLVVSVMAGVTLAQLRELTGATRLVRAMSSPAAELGLSYSPWVASVDVSDADRQNVVRIFDACGQTDEVSDERQLDYFTAMTGPVPGFVAYFASCMVDYAESVGISPNIADRAIKQLFLSGGQMLSNGPKTPLEHVNQMIDYDGTTAAGLVAMKKLAISDDIKRGLDAAVQKAKTIGVE